MLEIKNVVKSFSDNVILNDISLSIEENEVVTLLGANGAGKTTLINCILKLYNVDSGKILFDGVNISDIKNSKYYSDVSEIFDLRIFFVFIISLIGVFGFSLILGTLTLMYTKVASFETILSYLMLYFSGAFIPVSKFVVYTNPLSNATFIIKNISVVGVKDYFILILISLIWFGIGCLLFESIFKKSKKFNWSY